ncbi:MAG: hypothetical protein AAB133_04055 [Pseudomonadota bacterium]
MAFRFGNPEILLRLVEPFDDDPAGGVHAVFDDIAFPRKLLSVVSNSALGIHIMATWLKLSWKPVNSKLNYRQGCGQAACMPWRISGPVTSG